MSDIQAGVLVGLCIVMMVVSFHKVYLMGDLLWHLENVIARTFFYLRNKKGSFYRITFPTPRVVLYVKPLEDKDLVLLSDLKERRFVTMHWTHLRYGEKVNEEDIGLELLGGL